MRPAILTALVLCLLLVPPVARSSFSEHSPMAVLGEVRPRTYFIWTSEVGANISALAALRASEVPEVLALANGTGTWQILALSGQNGSLLASSHIRRGYVREIGTLGGYTIVLANASLIILGPSLEVAHEDIWPGSELRDLRPLTSEKFAFVRTSSLCCFSLANMSLSWSYSFGDADLLDIEAMPDGRILALELENKSWSLYSFWLNSTLEASLELTWLSWASWADLIAYNTTCFLLAALNTTTWSLYLLGLGQDEPSWSMILAQGPGVGREVRVFPMPDLDGDGYIDVFCWSAGRIRVISGARGTVLCSIEHDSNVISFCHIGDAYFCLLSAGYVLKLLRVSWELGEVSWLWSISDVSKACPLADLDGDGMVDLVAVRRGYVTCIWGSYDDEGPLVKATWPDDGLSTSFTHVVLMAEASDAQSGISSVTFWVDGHPIEGRYEPNTGCYVADVMLSLGEHIWYVEAVDKVGFSSITPPRRLIVNLSFFGGPDWLDDVLFFAPWAVAVGIASAAVARERKKGQKGEGRSE